MPRRREFTTGPLVAAAAVAPALAGLVHWALPGASGVELATHYAIVVIPLALLAVLLSLRGEE